MRDRKGRQIREGDLLRHKHFRSSIRGEWYYLYHVVTVRDKKWLAVPYAQAIGEPDTGGTWWLDSNPHICAMCEIIASVGDDFHDKERVKP